jgi:ABC-2 type transport system permease protein
VKAFYRLLIADFKQFFRDRTALFFTFIFPILFMIIFGLAFSGGNDVRYNVGLINDSQSTLGQNIEQAISQTPIFNITTNTLDDKLAELRKGDIQAVIHIPADLDSATAGSTPAKIDLYYDPSRTASSQVIIPVLNDILAEVNRRATNEPILFELAEQPIQSRVLRNIDYIVPGIIAMSILFLGMFGGLPMVEWREKQVLKRFGATPLKRRTIIASQVIYRLILALVQTLIIIGIGYFAYDVQIIGNWFAVLGIVLLGSLTLVSLGYLLVSRPRTTEGAMPIIQLVQFPMLFLSGIFFDVELMPAFIKPIINALPLTYLADALRQVMVEATPLHPLGVDLAALVGFLILFLLLTVKIFRWE